MTDNQQHTQAHVQAHACILKYYTRANWYAGARADTTWKLSWKYHLCGAIILHICILSFSANLPISMSQSRAVKSLETLQTQLSKRLAARPNTVRSWPCWETESEFWFFMSLSPVSFHILFRVSLHVLLRSLPHLKQSRDWDAGMLMPSVRACWMALCIVGNMHKRPARHWKPLGRSVPCPPNVYGLQSP